MLPTRLGFRPNFCPKRPIFRPLFQCNMKNDQFRRPHEKKGLVLLISCFYHTFFRKNFVGNFLKKNWDFQKNFAGKNFEVKNLGKKNWQIFQPILAKTAKNIAFFTPFWDDPKTTTFPTTDQRKNLPTQSP